MWAYYGRSQEHYARAEQELQLCPPSEYKATLPHLIAEHSAPKSGLLQATKTALHTIVSMLNSSSRLSQFFNQPLEATLYLDGKKMELPSPPTGIYIAAYEQQNFGLLTGIPSPGARAVAGKMEVILTYASVKDIVNDLPALMKGKHVRNTRYVQAQELTLEYGQAVLAQMDGEFMAGKEFTIRPDKALKFVSMR